MYAGIDPGSRSGALIIVDKLGTLVEELRFDKVSMGEIAEAIQKFRPKMTLLEKVHYRPSPGGRAQGGKSAFSFGENYGMLQGILAASKMRFEYITPVRWQKGMRLSPPKGSENAVRRKRYLKAEAKRLFPKNKVVLANADAFLLAELCRRWQLGMALI